MTILWILFFIAVLAVVLYLFAARFMKSEIAAVLDRDPAAGTRAEVIFTYPGLHALMAWRVSHFLNRAGLRIPARVVSQLARWVTGIEIHPAARISEGLFIDHGSGVVIGETAVIGKNVTLFQGVTLGGTGKEKGKRHPTLGDNVVVGAGAKVLGDITLGRNVMVGSNAVVLRDVPEDSTAVGVPARIAKRKGRRLPGGVNLDHSSLPDPLQQSLEKLQHEIDHIESEIGEYHLKKNKDEKESGS